MKLKSFLPPVLMLFFSCNEVSVSEVRSQPGIVNVPSDEMPASINKIPVPEGFHEISDAENDFSIWLGKVSLKKDRTVYLYDGTLKQNQMAQYAVLDISVGDKNLQQCADAVMRLRAEFLFAKRDFEKISFSDNEGKEYRFSAPYDRAHFMKYLNTVFGMCGSASLAKELKSKDLQNIAAGDVFIRGGFPGHAVIVMKTVVNNDGQTLYLLAQSYMPAQDIHILINKNNPQVISITFMY